MAFPVQHRLRQYVPLLASVALLVVFGLSLADQLREWLQLTRAPAPSLAGGQPDPGAAPDLARMELLFGTPPASPVYAPETSSASLTLLGSFVHSTPERSSAVIQLGGNPPRLYRVGEELEPGLRLHGVHADRIDLARGERLESLMFPANRQAPPAEQPVYPAAEPSPQPSPEQADPQQLKFQLEMLRQQIEASGASSPDAQPMEDD